MPKTAVLTADAKAAKRKAFRKHLKRYWVLYAMLVLPVAYYIVFKDPLTNAKKLPKPAVVPAE